jgi:hypothetical protein
VVALIISHQHRFVLLAPWKTATTTLHLRLGHLDESRYSRFYHFNDRLLRVVTRHITRAELDALPESRLGYRVAAFVRNPYDRVYSGFLQLQRDIESQPSMDFPEEWVRALVLEQLHANLEQLRAADFDFNRWWSLVGEHQIREAGRNSSFPLHPAHYWTHLAGDLAVEFVGTIERFEADFERFCTLVGVTPHQQAASANVADLPEARDHESGYRYLHLMSGDSIRKVNRLFSRDFELFGYEGIEPT